MSKKLSSKILTKALLEFKIPYECAKCCLGDKWNGKVLKLKIDFINADTSDYKISNLRFLCPNCYSQVNHELPKLNWKSFRKSFVNKRGRPIAPSDEIAYIEDIRILRILAKTANEN